MTTLIRFLAVGLVAVSLAGCGGGPAFDTAPVTGAVTQQGKPVASGRVIFFPIPAEKGELAGPAAYGNVKDGKYTLEGDGAVVGKNRVSLVPEGGVPDGGGGDDDEEEGSESFADSTQEVDVKAGQDNVIDLTF